MKVFKSSWRLEAVCGGCKSTNIKGAHPPFCGDCSRLGKQLVLMRKIRRFPYIKTIKEYRKYDNYVNPME